MNDRFRFRGWRGGKMTYGIETHTVEHNEMSGREGDVIDLSTWARYYTVMQSTGLKDKNGVLIYEGDILLHNHKYGEYLQSPVEWSDSIEDQEGVLYAGFTVDSRCVKDAMVVGNIYENPELLNK